MTTLTPAAAALPELADHCFNCPDCKTLWVGETPIPRSCPRGDELARKTLRTPRTTEAHPS